MIDRRLVENFDWGLLAIVMLVGGVGLVILYSAESAAAKNLEFILFRKQITWFLIGLTIMFFCFIFSYKQLDQWGTVFYIFCMILLVLVLLFGKYVAGSRRWLILGPLRLQPSELAKVVVIITLSKYYAKRVNIEGFSLKELIVPMMIIFIPFGLIVTQPDLGTALLIMLIAGSMTLFVKIERRTLIVMIIVLIIAVPLTWSFFLKGYQKQRVLTFLDPERDSLGAGYHIIQSKIAIGSGRMLGKGYLKGTQNALSFLPEQHTDFILSVLAEEWGFVGTGATFLLYMMLIVWGLNIAYRCRDPFGIILSVGVTSMIFWQAFINIGMVMGLMPVVGVPLPLISYGGSSVVTSLIGIGLLMNVSMRRFTIE